MDGKALEAALAAEFRRYHVRAQIQRLVVGAASVFVLQILAGGLAHWSAKAVIAAAVGALWVTARAQWPSLPWGMVTAHAQAPAQAPTASPQDKQVPQ